MCTTRKHINICAKHINTYMHTNTQMCIQTQTHVYTLKCINNCTYLSLCLSHLNIQTNTRTQIRTYTYIYTRTLMQCGGRENSVFSLISHHIATGVVHEPLSGQEHAISGMVYLCTTDSGCVPTPTHFLNHFVVIHWDPYR